MIKFTILAVLLLANTVTFGQGFKVKSFKTNISDLSASVNARVDEKGITCGLVKVLTQISNVEFDGNVVGETANHTNEYWVYLSDGAKEFSITRPNYLPMTVRFSDYKIEEIKSKMTYVLVLKEQDLNQEKCGVTIHLKPRDAEVIIDDIPLKKTSDGDYLMILPKGDHTIRFTSTGYKSEVKMIKTGKGVQTLDIELESLLADVNIISQTNTAEIFVNGESKGIGGWKGKMLAGQYEISLRQKGYLDANQTITLAEKETRTINLPALKPIKGSLNIRTTPSGCQIILDGSNYGTSPCEIRNVKYGNHKLIIKLDSEGFKREKEVEINVSDEKAQQIDYELASPQQMKCYHDALELMRRGIRYSYGDCGEEGIYDTHDENLDYFFGSVLKMVDYLEQDFYTTIIKYEDCVEGVFQESMIADGLIGYCTSKNRMDMAEYIANKAGGTIGSHKIARSYANKKEYEKAITWYLKGEYYFDIGNIYYNNKKYEEAISWYMKEHDKGTNYGGSTYSQIVKCYLSLKNIKEARKWFQTFITLIEPSDEPYIVKPLNQMCKDIGFGEEALVWEQLTEKQFNQHKQMEEFVEAAIKVVAHINPRDCYISFHLLRPELRNIYYCRTPCGMDGGEEYYLKLGSDNKTFVEYTTKYEDEQTKWKKIQ